MKIVNGEENTAPKIEFESQLLMGVNQFVMTAFTSSMMRATDVESDEGDIIFNVTRPLLENQGVIVSTDDQNTPIRSFRQRDVQDLKIAYLPPADESGRVRTVEFSFQAVDTEGLVSDEESFLIEVFPMQTLAPKATRNTGQLLYQVRYKKLLFQLLSYFVALLDAFFVSIF